MKVQNTQHQNTQITRKSPAFNGIPIAKIQLRNLPVSDEITILKIDKDDLNFLYKMFDKINLEKFYPKMKDKTDFDKWKDMILSAITNIEFGTKGLLAVRSKKPCGILSFSEINANKEFYIDHVATWPSGINEGTKGAGKSLFRQIFEDGISSGKTGARLVPDSLKPRGKHCKDFYSEIGFKENPSTYTTEIKSDSKENGFQRAAKKLNEIMEYKKIQDADAVDLEKILILE